MTQISHDLLADETAAAARAERLRELEAKGAGAPLASRAGDRDGGRVGTRVALATANTRLSDD